jgi:DNA (cytosine-5)-methyltransferase 1
MAHLRTFHLFAGAGGGILADLLLGHIPVGACEIEPYPRNVLLARQRDGFLPKFPIWDDVCTLDGKPWRGSVDVLCGGFPCTDISPARKNNHINGKITGLDGKHSGLWFAFERVVEEMRTKFVFVENSKNLRTKGLHTILQNLNRMGYNTRRCVLGSRDVGADHWRDRMWILAYTDKPQLKGSRDFAPDTRMARTIKLNYVWGGVVRPTSPKKDGRNGWFLTLMAVAIMRLT